MTAAYLLVEPGHEAEGRGRHGRADPLTEVGLRAVPAKTSADIQADIQYEADQVCKQRGEADPRAQLGIVMDPKTGAILAMAQWPTYNPDDPVPYASTTNIATANVFAPGSTLKPVTVAAALEQGGQTPLSAYTIPYQIKGGQRCVHVPRRRGAPDRAVHHRRDPGCALQQRLAWFEVAQRTSPPQQQVQLPARLWPRGEERPRHSGPGQCGRIARRAARAAAPAPRIGQVLGGQPVMNTPSARESERHAAIQMASIYATIANNGVVGSARRKPDDRGTASTGQLGRYVHPGADNAAPASRVIQAPEDGPRADDDDAPAGAGG